MQSSSVNMLNRCIDMLLVPLTRSCFWSLRMPSVWEMLVRSKKPLKSPYTLGTWLCCMMEYREKSASWELWSPRSPCLYSLSPKWKDHKERHCSLTVNLCLLEKIWDNTDFLQNNSGPSFILEVTCIEVDGYSPFMSTKPVSNRMVRAASGRG